MIPVILAVVWLGTLLALAGGPAWAQAVVGLGAVALPLAVMRDRRGVFVAAAALGVATLAWLRWQAATAPPPSESVAWWADGSRSTVAGRVAEAPVVRGGTQRFRLSVRRIEHSGRAAPARGDVLVRVPASRPLRAGDLVRLDGRLDQPPVLADFDYRAYLARQGVHAVMEYPRVRVEGREPARGPAAWLEAARTRARAALWRGLPATEAALAEGILTGRRAEIPRDVSEEFNRAGVSHLIVISGFNIALLGGFVMAVFRPLLGLRRAAVPALAAIALYSVFVGLTPPVARAALMGGVTVLALLSGRPHGTGVALLTAAVALTAQDPCILHDLSFQLSFAATAGLLLLAPAPQAWGRRLLAEVRAPDGVTWRSFALAAWDTLAVTLAATVATMPLLLLHFQRLSVVSPLANLLLVPLFPAVLVAGTLGLAAAAVAPAIAPLALAPVGGLLELSVAIVHRCAHLPGASLTVGGVGGAQAAFIYLVMAAAVFGRLPGRRPALPPRERHLPRSLTAHPLPLLAFAPAALVLVVFGSAVAQRGSATDEARVEAFDLPGTHAALVTFPRGGHVLVDTGLAPRAARAALDDSPAAGTRTLAAVVVTRDAPSAFAGLPEVLRRYRVDVLLVPPAVIGSDAAWLAAARDAGVHIEPLRTGLALDNGRARLAFAPPSRHGDRWSVTLHHGLRQIVLTGPDGDAGVARDGRHTRVYLSAAGTRVHATLAQGDRAQLRSDGRRIRLSLPPGRAAAVARDDGSAGQPGHRR